MSTPTAHERRTHRERPSAHRECDLCGEDAGDLPVEVDPAFYFELTSTGHICPTCKPAIEPSTTLTGRTSLNAPTAPTYREPVRAGSGRYTRTSGSPEVDRHRAFPLAGPDSPRIAS